MSRKHKRTKRSDAGEAAELPMTPMIDVVFQLLIYFIFTMKPVDVMAHLDVFRPSAEDRAPQTEMPKVLRIDIFQNGYTLNDRRVTESVLNATLETLAGLDTKQTVLIMCTALSQHHRLVTVLDMCSQHGLTNLSVISTN